MNVGLKMEEHEDNRTFFDPETGKFLHANFGDWLISQHHIIKIENKIHIYDGRIYRSDSHSLEHAMQQEIRVLRSAQRAEVIKYIDVVLDNVDPGIQDRYIAFKNGLYDLKTGKLGPFTPDVIIRNIIPFDYNPSARSDLLDHTLMTLACGDPEIKTIMEEMAGYCFFGENTLGMSFILTGKSGSNGKSTFINLLKYVLGKDNYSSLDIDELADRFSTIRISGKLANLGDDIKDTYLAGKQLSVFKKLVTGETLKCEEKGQPVSEFEPKAKMVFSANEVPKFQTRGFDAIKRRVAIVPFNNHFTHDTPGFDPDLNAKLRCPEVAEALIKIGVDALQRVLKQKRFTQSKKAQAELLKFEIDNNPIISFLDEVDVVTDVLSHPTGEVYNRYSIWCKEHGYKAMASGSFTKEINHKLGCETKKKSVKDPLTGKWKTARVFHYPISSDDSPGLELVN